MDRYLHDYDNVSSIIVSLKQIRKNYEDKILELKKLINDISTSSLWIDQTLKTTFVACCNGYISQYDKISGLMEAYINYLEKKSEAALQLETAYSRGV